MNEHRRDAEFQVVIGLIGLITLNNHSARHRVNA